MVLSRQYLLWSIYAFVCAPRCVAWHESKKGAETTLEDKLMQLMQRVRNGVANQPGKVWLGATVFEVGGRWWVVAGAGVIFCGADDVW